MTRPGLLAPAALVLALALAACGRQGELARPGPLFGDGRNVPPQTSTGPASNADADGQPSSSGIRNTDQLDPNRRLDPASSNAIDGTSDPIGDRPSTTPR